MRETAKELSPLGVRINDMRGLETLGQLAAKADMNYSSLYRIMHGESRATRETLLKICCALDCTVAQTAFIFEVTDYRAPTREDLDKIKDARTLPK